LALVRDQAQKLFETAELSVNRQPGIQTSHNTQPSSTSNRASALISPAQLKFMEQLLTRQPHERQKILADNGVTAISFLTSRAASDVIARLKGATV
jgi:hypothetical protein